jgi:hypothetical protein
MFVCRTMRACHIRSPAVTEGVGQSSAMDPDDREFMRELLRRHEKASDAMLARFNAITRRFDEHTDEMRQDHGQFIAEIREAREDHRGFIRELREDHREFIAELRAQRGALLRILDRLDGGAAGAGA